MARDGMWEWLQEGEFRRVCLRALTLALVCLSAASLKLAFWGDAQASGQQPRLQDALEQPLCVAEAEPIPLWAKEEGPTGQAVYGKTEAEYKQTLRKPNILVVKSEGRLYLYDGDQLFKTYSVITGAKPGAKQRSGDMKTPEGEFYVCVKNPQSRYYLSLGLSYPTPADADRGLQQGLINKLSHEQIHTAHKQRQQPVWRTPLGGSIMIHGVAPGRTDTDGCIALLDNDEMKEIFDLIPQGAPVTVRP